MLSIINLFIYKTICTPVFDYFVCILYGPINYKKKSLSPSHLKSTNDLLLIFLPVARRAAIAENLAIFFLVDDQSE